MSSESHMAWFTRARYGLFVHYGLYSLLGRGEWARNREQIPVDEYRSLADRFTASHFDAEALCDLAVAAGMKYIVLTTMHQEGFRLYDTQLSDFCTTRTACGRDLVREMIDAARSRNLRVGLYHSLNNWNDQPDGVAALEDAGAYDTYIHRCHQRIRELVTMFNPIDLLWYDGWWPFDADGWQAQAMNQMVRSIQPHIVLNGRNGLPGDFATPEQHMGPPQPWRPWEACMTLNNNWGYHQHDDDWKSPRQVVDMLATVAAGGGNLLLNVGPRGDGSIPDASSQILRTVGGWLERHGECIFDTDRFTFALRERGDHRGDWSHHGFYTARNNTLYLLARRWPGQRFAIGGLECRARRVSLVHPNQELTFSQTDRRLVIHLPEHSPDPLCSVIRVECDRPPALYLSAGMRVPRVPHPAYDPCPSDIAH